MVTFLVRALEVGEDVARFGTAKFDQAVFAKEIAIGSGEIVIGAGLAVLAGWFIRDGVLRIMRALKKRREQIGGG